MELSLAFILFPIFAGLFAIRKYREFHWGSYASKSLLTGKVFVVTGSNSGIGKAVAKSLAQRNACVIMACRDLSRAQSAIEDIRQSTSSGDLVPMHLDLASFDCIRNFAKELQDRFPRVHVLINNAGVYYPISSKEKTVDGFEINFGVNYLGHFLLTNLLINKLKDSSPSRIVTVSSGLHEKGVIDINDLNMEKRKNDVPNVKMNAAYCASKLANVYHSRELAQRLAGSGVDVFALCPGFTYTNLFRHSNLHWAYFVAFLPIAFFYMRSSSQAAQTVLLCATDESLTGKSYGFYSNCKPHKSAFQFDSEIQKQLWQKSEEITKF